MSKFDRRSLRDDGNYEFPVDDLEDDEATVDLAMSSIDGSAQEFGSLKNHPKERRMQTERIAMYTFLAFIVAMFIGLIPLSWKKRSDSFLLGDSLNPLGEKNMIQCAGSDRKITLKDWLRQDMEDISRLCNPLFLGQSEKADPTRTPVKVFIMMGEANMVGAGLVEGNVDGTLEYTVETKQRFRHLESQDGSLWNNPRNDVRHVAVQRDFEILENDWLAVKKERGYFGPEIQFGYVMGEIFDEPVLIIKAAQGHNSLGGEMLPPGSKQYEMNGYTYAGYGDSPQRWETGTSRMKTSWRAGMKYDENVANAKNILRNIQQYYPGASTYEVVGFVWWQGNSDRRVPAYAARYEENLVRLINALRFDFRAPHAKVVVATIGQDGMDMSGATLDVAQAQMNLGSFDDYPQHQGNVAVVDTRGSWRGPYQPGHEGDHNYLDGPHYGNNAETFMEVGNAMGLSMARLLI
ncbi:carbohydrate esterase / alpha-galactosidase [Nitzschia inconspicua]|uniref:Carbohydrate esterase / alpha-galactosidase n=1 Tax=Nitzschia inconspicua TaxID=303405 RepID=A0A9K3LQW6_9STRA|nr:carbohydrate esterase / alpha-galactosidase [Nitzschia inconspicua]